MPMALAHSQEVTTAGVTSVNIAASKAGGRAANTTLFVKAVAPSRLLKWPSLTSPIRRNALSFAHYHGDEAPRTMWPPQALYSSFAGDDIFLRLKCADNVRSMPLGDPLLMTRWPGRRVIYSGDLYRKSRGAIMISISAASWKPFNMREAISSGHDKNLADKAKVSNVIDNRNILKSMAGAEG